MIQEAAPATTSDQYADDYTLRTSAKTPEDAAILMRPALDAVSRWAKDNVVEMSVEKTEAVVVSLDPQYASGAWGPFLADTHRRKLESANYSAARAITGAR